MTTHTETLAAAPVRSMSLFERYLTVWVVLCIVAQAWRRALTRRGQAAFDRALARIGPLSIAALLLTLILLFASQGQAILQ